MEALIRRGGQPGNALAPEAAKFFRLDRVESPTEIAAGFAVVIALDEGVELTLDSGTQHTLLPGSTTLMPFAAGSYVLEGPALVARPPAA